MSRETVGESSLERFDSDQNLDPPGREYVKDEGFKLALSIRENRD